MDLFTADVTRTRKNQQQLYKNRNLLFWYQALFDQLFAPLGDLTNRRVLEIGSGTSPVTFFYPSVYTSDVLPLPHLDFVFDCHEIDQTADIEDESLDAVTMTNVLHHLKDPVGFLVKAARKLKPGGQILAAEPYYSVFSRIIYKTLHHEPSGFSIFAPRLGKTDGPLSDANMAVPYMLFFTRPGWQKPLRHSYDLKRTRISHFSFLTYPMTGGISRRLPVPGAIYRAYFPIDFFLATRFPKWFAFFFLVKLTKRN